MRREIEAAVAEFVSAGGGESVGGDTLAAFEQRLLMKRIREQIEVDRRKPQVPVVLKVRGGGGVRCSCCRRVFTLSVTGICGPCREQIRTVKNGIR